MNALIEFCAANWGYFAVALAAYIVKEGRRVQRGD